MGRSKFVGTGVVRIDLSDDEWIEVKQELSYGEQKHLAGNALVGSFDGKGDPAVDFDLEEFTLSKVLVWLADWSFTDEQGNKVRVSRDALGALRGEVGDEVEAAIDKHAAAIAAEREAAKNLKAQPLSEQSES